MYITLTALIPTRSFRDYGRASFRLGQVRDLLYAFVAILMTDADSLLRSCTLRSQAATTGIKYNH